MQWQSLSLSLSLSHSLSLSLSFSLSPHPPLLSPNYQHHLQSARSVASSKEFPIFKREDANYQLPSGILHMTASNGYITITLVGNTIYRFHVKNPRGHAECKFIRTCIRMYAQCYRYVEQEQIITTTTKKTLGVNVCLCVFSCIK